ncbi:hypothetical protein ACHAXS_011156 [Conticribra weissflogii]
MASIIIFAQQTPLVFDILVLNIILTYTLAFQQTYQTSNRFIEFRDYDDGIAHKISRMKNHRDKHVSLGMQVSSTSISDQVKWRDPPYLALLTEPDACSSVQRMEETLHAIKSATFDGGVTLVVVRVQYNEEDDIIFKERKMTLLQQLADLKEERFFQQEERKKSFEDGAGGGGFFFFFNNDLDLAIEAISQNVALDGIHVKERNAGEIPTIRKMLHDAAERSKSSNNHAPKSMESNGFIVGTSCHSLQSAINSYTLQPQGPDYLFVGTCYLTQSHPEKVSIDQLEGPGLPGKVKKELEKLRLSCLDSIRYSVPKIFAIGGIDERNCFEPVVKYGADGVATIRAVMKAEDPRAVVQSMIRVMQQ